MLCHTGTVAHPLRWRRSFIGLYAIICLAATSQTADLVLYRGVVVASDHEIEGPYVYLDIRDADGQSVLISGSRDIPVLAWLMTQRDGRVRIVLTREEDR